MDEAIENLKAFIKTVDAAVWSGYEAFVSILPGRVYSQLKAIAISEDQRLNSTLEEYLQSVSVSVKNDGLIVIEMDASNWLANALEGGVKGWDMRQTHLRNPDWTDKQGYRYKVIPLKPRKKYDKDGNPTVGRPELSEDSRRIQAKLNDFLGKSKNWDDATSLKANKPDASKIYKVAKSKSEDSDLRGLYRIQEFSSLKSKKPTRTTYVAFRTITDKPPKDGKAKWQHPGIEARNYFPKLKSWMDGPSGSRDFEDALEEALERAFR